MKANINEIFTSIQGEGVNMGEPCTFVRFSGCNLSCPGCDTKYHIEGHQIEIEKVIEMIKGIIPPNKFVVFTGGEPLLQQEAIVEILKGIEYYANWKFEIETNGSIDPKELLSFLRGTGFDVNFSISPKLKSFNDQPYVFQKGCNSWRKCILKFVVTSEEDIKEVKKLQAASGVFDKNIYLMPEGATKKEQEEKMKKVVELAVKYGYKFCPRIHILIWDNQKGV